MRELLTQSLKFLVVGMANTSIGLSIIYGAMFFFNISPEIANAIGYAAGLSVSYLLNRSWTFNHSHSKRTIVKYILIAGLCYSLNLLIVLALIRQVSLNPYLAQLFGIGFYTAAMFAGCRWYVFKKAPTQPPRHEKDLT